MKKKIIKFSTVLVVIYLLGFVATVFAEDPVFTDNVVAQAAFIQAQNENALFALPGVHGVGIGKQFGQAVIVVFVDEQSSDVNIPTELGDMPVIVRQVGRIVAEQINLGVSIGNDILCAGPCPGGTCYWCDGGTAGFKVCDNTVPNVGGFITNNHVAVSGCPGKCPNNAPLGTTIVEPGIQTMGCNVAGATNIGTLNRFVTLTLDGSTLNDADVAFVQSTDADVTDTIQGLGLQSNTIAAASVGVAVCKSGATTGVTCGQISAINLTIDVGYGQAGDPSPGPCGTGAGRFRNIIEYEPLPPDTDMSEGGDSGAPVVLDDGSNDAVAIHFAGESGGPLGYGIPIGTALSLLDVSLCSDIPGPPTADANGPYNADCGGITTTVQLDGTGSSDPDGDTLTYSWTTDCPCGSFDDSTSATPVLTVSTSPGCAVVCGVTLTVTTDGDGATDDDTTTVTITDTTAPDITCPDDVTIECDESTDPSNTGLATATDNCDPSPAITYTDVETPGVCAAEKTITRTWEATDECGNTNSCDQIITVVDTTSPDITCPADVTIECDESTDPGNTGSATATDNCDPSPDIAYTDVETPGACAAEKTITRTWVATDDCGNTDSCDQTINVVDTTAPVITCNAPANITPPDAPISFTATAVDNCDPAPSVSITAYDCRFFTKKGKEIDKKKSCIVNVDGDTITILDSGGVGTQITWTVRAVDECGNVSEVSCMVDIVNPHH